MKIEDFVDKLENVTARGGGYMARCPSHEDRKASLSVDEGEKGIVVNCHAGCTPLAVVNAMGLEMRDLFYDSGSYERDGSPRSTDIVATYVYTDAAGSPLFEVVRFKPKDFRQRLVGSDEWGLKGLANKPLFHLPQLLKADPGDPVFVVEGEKDVLALERAGAVATTSVGGAGKWDRNYSHHLRGRRVLVVADKDEPGMKHAIQVRDSLEDVADVTVVQAKVGKDASDHLAAGGTLTDFIVVPVGLGGLTLTRFDTIEEENISWVPGWEKFIPFAGLTSLVGMPGVNKSTLSARIVADVTRAGRQAMICAGEDAIAQVVRPRLAAAGADLSRVMLVGGDGKHVVFPRDAEALMKNAIKEDVGVVLIDPIDAHLDFAVASNAYNNPVIRTALAPLAELAGAANAAVILVGHPNKNRGSDPMMRAGGSIGIPGAARSALMMGNHPQHPESAGYRVLASYKRNWTEPPQARQFEVEWVGPSDSSIRLVDRGNSWVEAWQLLNQKPQDES